MSPEDPRHGKNRGYIAGCREACCRAAHARHHKNQRTRKYLARVDSLQTDGLGTRRRIQALMAIGWSSRELDKMVGRQPSYLYRILTSTGDVYLTTANMVADLYDRLSMTPPTSATEPGKAVIRRNVNMARRKGYLPPLAWDDIDDPNEQPNLGRDRSYYTAAELASEWRWLERSGESIEQAARQLGVTVGAIEKALERAGRDAA